eukprot:scaffold10274_cov106-Isochrysis_galbana.AAC.5
MQRRGVQHAHCDKDAERLVLGVDHAGGEGDAVAHFDRREEDGLIKACGENGRWGEGRRSGWE